MFLDLSEIEIIISAWIFFLQILSFHMYSTVFIAFSLALVLKT